MGKTLKALQEEIQNIWNIIFHDLSEEEKKLTKPAKRELRKYLNGLATNKVHSYSHIFIRRRIRELQEQFGIAEESISQDIREWHDSADFQI